MLSILMPVYNSGRFVFRTIQSILSQSYHNFELIIYDDSSTDNTLEIIHKFNDSRIKIYYGKSNIGVRAARDFLLSISKGDYLSFVDSDDICFKNKFAKQIDFLEKNQNINLVGSKVNYINEGGRSIVYPFSFESFSSTEIKINLIFSNTLSTSTVVFRASIKHDICFAKFPFDIAEDYFIWSKLAKKYDFANINQALVSYRIVKKGLMHVNKPQLREALNFIQSPLLNDLNIPSALLFHHNAFLYTQITTKFHLKKNVILYILFFRVFKNNRQEIKRIIKNNLFRKCLNFSRFNFWASLLEYIKISSYLKIFSLKYLMYLLAYGFYQLLKK